MATGVLAPGPLVAEPFGSTDLAGAVLELPSFEVWILIAPSAGERGSLADPRPVAFAFAAVEKPAHGLAIFEKIHVIPRVVDLGAVISEQEITVEVWNAFRAASKLLEAISVDPASGGVTVVDHLGAPVDLPATDSQVFTVVISAEGDPLLDVLVTWAIADVDDGGTTLRLLGFRLMPFPYRHDHATPIRERFGFLTDLLTAFNGMEQRIQLRATPRGSIRHSADFETLQDLQMANAILFGNQARPMGVPRWQYRTPLTAAASIDDVELLCDPTDLPFVAGGLAFLWAGPRAWEAQTIESVAADRITITRGLGANWPAGTLVIPMVIGRLAAEQPIVWEGLHLGSQELIWDVDQYQP